MEQIIRRNVEWNDFLFLKKKTNLQAQKQHSTLYNSH